MTNTTFWLAVAVTAGVVGLALLWLGVRGRRIDREPRCPARRCGYALGSVIHAKGEQNEGAFPLTCPECGRAIPNDRALRIGTRKARRSLVAAGVVLTLAALSLGGFTAYLRWSNTSPVTVLPLWLLLRQAERDSDANQWKHQAELARRVWAGDIAGRNAQRVIDRILAWQTDPRIEMAAAGDAFAILYSQGQVSADQLRRFWEQIFHVELRLPDAVEAGGPLPIEVRLRFRGALNHNAPLPRDVNGAFVQANSFMNPIVEARRVSVGRVDVPLSESDRRLYQHMGAFTIHANDFGLRSHFPAWDALRAPAHATDNLPVEVEIFVSLGAEHMTREVAPGVRRRLSELLEEVGLPTTLTVTRSGVTRVVDALAPVDARDDADTRAWLEGKMREAVVEARRPRNGDPHVLVRFPPTTWDAPRPARPLRLIGDLTLRRGDETFAAVWTDTAVGASLPGVMIPRDSGARAADAIDSFTDSWELVFTPRPDRADRRVERIPVFAGPPIGVPVAVRPSGTPRPAPPPPFTD